MIHLERACLIQLLKDLERPRVAGVTYTLTKEGTLAQEEHHSLEEVTHLLQSPEYQLGWEACRERVAEVLDLIHHGNSQDLQDYLDP